MRTQQKTTSVRLSRGQRAPEPKRPGGEGWRLIDCRQSITSRSGCKIEWLWQRDVDEEQEEGEDLTQELRRPA